jgi:hypothetical protein
MLDARSLLARINPEIAALRRQLSRPHDEDAPRAQSRRAYLRIVANLLHVERANARGRVHGTRFTDLEAQRAWLESMERRACSSCAAAADLPHDATLAKLRAGEL